LTIETPGPQPRLASIQYLRAAAALGVLAFHAALTARSSFPVGAYGVTLFFVISGFVMVRITSEASRPLAFLADRLRRIVPVYWLVTFAGLAVSAALSGKFRFTATEVAASLLFLPYGDPLPDRHYIPIIAVGWTLNYEMMFYAIFACGLLLPRSFQLVAVSAAFGALVLLGKIVRPTTAPLEFWCAPIILEFLAGMWLAAAVRPRGADVPQWLAWGFLVALLLLVPRTVPAVLLLAGALALEAKSRAPRWRLPLLLGDASYSIYLWHLFAVTACAILVNRLHLPPSLILPLGIAAGLAVGLAGYKLLEEPLLRLVRRDRGRAAGRAPRPGEPAGQTPAPPGVGPVQMESSPRT
jgi:exopolysaccharide production protein ExoZ